MLGSLNGRAAAMALSLSAAFGGYAAAQDGPVKVGFAADLTGACAALAEDGLNGARIAAEEINAVFAPLFGPSLGAVLKQGQGFGFFQKANLVTLMTVDTLQSQGASMPASNVYGIARAPFFALDQTPEVTAFIEKYRAAYKEYPTDWAISAYDGLRFYAAVAEHAGSVAPDAIVAALPEVSFDGLRERGLKVRALDGQMNAPSYVGKAAKVDGYDFPILTEVEKFEGAPLMPPEALILKAREAAK